MPRNVDAGCSEVKGAYCYNVDDLKAVVEKNTAMRKREMVEAEFILREEQDKFRLWQQVCAHNCTHTYICLYIHTYIHT